MNGARTPNGFSLPPGHALFLLVGIGFISFGMISFIVIIPRDARVFVGSSLLAVGAYNFIGSGYLARRVLRSTRTIVVWNPWALAGEARVRAFFRQIGAVFGAAGIVFLLRALFGV